jgi:hypothetical protein
VKSRVGFVIEALPGVGPPSPEPLLSYWMAAPPRRERRP